MNATNDDAASRGRIAAMPLGQQADLYDAVAADFARAGITKSAYLHNMAALRAFNEAIRPATCAYDAAVAACANQAARDAKHWWEEAAERLRPGNQPAARPMAEIERERREALQAYEEAICSSGDERVIETWRVYREALQAATDAYAKSLRL